MNRITAATFVITALVLASGGAVATAPSRNGGSGENLAPEFLFASGANDHTIGVWQIDAGTGSLTPVPESPFPAVGGQPQGMAVHPSGKFLYGVNWPMASAGVLSDPGGITASSIAGNGELAAIGPEVANPQQGGAGLRVAVDSTGTHAYVAGNISIGAAAYAIDLGTGALTPLNPLPFDFQNHHGTADLAVINRKVYLTSAVGIDSQTINSDGSLNAVDSAAARTVSRLDRLAVSGGKFLYATTVIVPPPGTPFAGPEPGHIYGWVVNGDGSLTQIASTPVALAGVEGMVASGNLLFASSPAGVTVYTVDSSSGVLSQITGSPFSGGTQFGDLAIDRSGKFLYAVTGSRIAAFAIASGGTLSPVPGSPFSTGSLQPFALATTP